MNRIYEIVADKTLSFGCKVIIENENKPGKMRVATWISPGRYISRGLLFTENSRNRRFKQSWIIHEVIGHPIMYGDFIARWEEKQLHMISDSSLGTTIRNAEIRRVFLEDMHRLWRNKKEPYEVQSKECHEFVELHVK